MGSRTGAPPNLRLLRFAAGGWLARLRHSLSVHRPLLFALRGRPAERLLIAPQDIRTADAIAAEHIYAGYFPLAGKMANTHGQSPFTLAAPSPAWSEALHGFGWLRHLRAAGTALARAHARALVEDWLNLEARGALDRLAARNPPVMARRLISWLSQSPMILEGADHDFYRRFVRAIAAHAAWLERALAGAMPPDERLTAIVALTQAGLCLEGASRLLRRATLMLERELPRRIYADGGHISRNPRALVELLVDFLPTRQAFVARNAAAPDALVKAIERMGPMLRMFRHADGALASFNGMGVSEPETLATLLAHGAGGEAAPLEARESGYQRLEANGVIVILDAGPPPPPAFSRQAHAGCLSFELSSALCRLVVNCGAPGAGGPKEARELARATAAHSTLAIDDCSSCRFTPAGARLIAPGVIAEGPARVEVKRGDGEADGSSVEASHDGYARRYGALHRRTLTLSPDGARLQGEDRAAPAGEAGLAAGKTLAVRFHLHPSVRIERAELGEVLLIATSGEKWRFEAPDRKVSLEDSIIFTAPGGARPTKQIVLRGPLNEAPIRWSFRRLPGAAPGPTPARPARGGN